MDLKEKITALVNKYLEDDSYFIVDIMLHGGSNINKVSVLLDGDQGVSIAQCARISRKVGFEIEELDLIPGAYILEVSSPGVEIPLKTNRQYKKNIGRRLEITLHDGSVKTGRLEEVKEDGIQIASETVVKKKTNVSPLEIKFTDIKKSNVLVSFN